MSEDRVYIRCLRTSEVADLASGSSRRPCAACGAEVYLDAALVPEIRSQHPGCEIVVHCRQCPIPTDDSEQMDVEYSPGQVRRLRAEGATDDEIAELFALAKVAGPHGDLGATRARIAAQPTGPEAQAFAQALPGARVYVALTLP